jgi:hypothetical protein
MKSLLPSPRYRFTTILILIIVCAVALIKSASSFAQEERPIADRTKVQESGPAQGSDQRRAGSAQQEKKTDVLERLISSDPVTKTPGDTGIMIPSQVDAGANLLLPVISATMVDALVVDVDGDGRFDPGDTIEYTVTINNTGPDPATGVKFADTVDANTTLVALSVNSSPIAFDDTVYTATGNIRIAIPDGATDLIANDIDPDTQNNSNLTAVVETKKSANCAACATNNVSISANGSFTYDPPPGFTGSDTFTYTVRDTGPDGIANNADDATGTGTATFTVSGMIWFINSAAGVNGDGRLTSPFNCLRGPACFDTTTVGGAADDPGDNIFLYNGAYTGGLTLLANQRFIGQGATSPLTGAGSITGLIPPAGSDPVPSTNGTPSNVSITTSVASTNAVNLGSGNTLRGFTIGNVTGSGISGSAFGTLTVGPAAGASDVVINGNGQALNLTNGTAAGVGFDSITSTGGTNNISLNTISGTLALGSGALSGSTSGAANHAFFVSGGNATITYSGNITKANTGNVVNIASKTGGGVTLSGTINGTSSSGINVSSNTAGTIEFSGGTKTLNTAGSTAVSLSSNTGATINFSNGGLNIDTTSGAGFNATGGGTVNVTGSANTIDSTTGTALNVNATTIGASGLTFRSISSNGAPSGIILNNTGSSANGLIVTGNSSGFCGGQTSGTPPAITQVPDAADCTGGTIQSSTGAGILLTSTSNVSLTRMRILNGGNDGIFGTTVTGLSLTSSLIDNNGNAVEEAGMDFDNLFGTSSVTNSTIRLSHENNIEVRNTTNNGSQATLTVTGCAISNASAKTQSDDGVLYQMTATSNGSVNVSNSVFTANRGDHLQANQTNSATLNAVFTNNTLTGGHSTALGADIVINATVMTGAASVTYDINGNRITGAILSAITVNLGVPSAATTTMSGKVRNNVIGTAGVIRSCSEQANGIAIDSHGKGTHTVSVTGNTMRQCKDRGINVTANDSPSISNGEAQPGGNLNLTVQSNTVLEGSPINPPGFPADGTGGREGFNLIAGSIATDTIAICAQVGGAGALANNFNRGPEGIISGLSDIRIKKQTTATMNIRLPGLPANTTDASSFVAPMNTSSEDGSSTAAASATSSGGGGGSFVGGAPCTTPAFFEELSRKMTPLTSVETNAGLNPVPPNVDVNYDRLSIPMWQPTLIASMNRPSATQSASSTNMRYGYANASLNHAPRVRRSQEDKSQQEEKRPASDNNTQVKSPQETKSPQESGDVVDETPIKQDKEDSPDSGETVNVGGAGGFTLPSGKSTVIKFRVTIDTGVLPAFTQVSTQGTVSSNIAPVQTDDTALGGANDPTITPIDHTTVALVSSPNPSVYGQPVTFTATMTGVPARASDPPGTVQFKRNGVDFGGPVPVVVGAVGDNVSTAQSVALSAPDLSVGNHVITAVYSGGGVNPNGYNTNLGTLATGQTVNKANSASAIITDTPDPSLTGQSVNVSFTVSAVAPGAGTPTGDVTVSDGVDQCTATAAVGNCSLTLTTAGVRNLTATYVGDGNFNASPASPAATHTVTATATWVGGTSTDWDTDTNWGTGRKPNLPSHSANIPAAGVTNEPTISVADVLLTDLTVATGRTLTLNLGRILTATGNTTLSGNLAGGGTSNFNNLTINNAAGVAIGGNANVSGVLTLTSGNTTVTGTLAVGGGGSITRTAGHIIGNLRKTFAAPGSFTYHVGTPNGYSPLATTVTAGSGDLTVKANEGTVPPLNAATTLQRYWTLTEAGSLTANLTFNYLQTDVMGNEAVYRIIRVEGGVPISIPNNCPTGPCVNPATNTAIINGVTNFSEWTIGEQFAPTAINADVSGRVTYANGRPMRGVIVSLLNTNTSEVVVTRTNAKGQYRFSDVATGVGYVVTPFKEGYEFNPPNQFISHTGVRENLDFGSAVSNPGPASDNPAQGGEAKHGSNPIPADFVPPAEP